MLKICIVARKRLKFNTRLIRQAFVLSHSGFEVTVVSLENPVPEFRQLVPTVRFLEVQLDPWPNVVIRFVRKSIRLSIAGLLIIFIGKKRLLERKKKKQEERSGSSLDYKIINVLRKLLAPYVNLARTRQFASRAGKVLVGEEFHMCQAHDSFALPAASKIIGRKRISLVYDAVEAPDERSGTALSGAQQWFKKMEFKRDEKIIRRAGKIYSIGPSLAKWTAKRYSVEMPTVVRNCCVYWNYTPQFVLRDDLKISEDIKLGIIVGSIYQGQGLEYLAHALQSCAPHIQLAAIGPVNQDGYKEHLERCLADFKISHRFHLLPPQPQNNIIPYIAGADFGVIALMQDRLNHRLALPNKLFEYIMARLPIATANINDVVNIVRKYRIGAVYDEGNIRDLVRCLNDVSLMKGEQKIKNNIEKAARELCWESEGNIYINSLKDISKFE